MITLVNALHEVLTVDDIVLDVEAFTCAQLFGQIAELFAQRHGVDSRAVREGLLAREAIGSTGLGHGVGIPHARIAGLTRELAILVRTREAIPFAAPDNKPVSMLLFLLVPEHAVESHLALLALLASAAKLFSQRSFRDRLQECTDAESAFQLLVA